MQERAVAAWKAGLVAGVFVVAGLPASRADAQAPFEGVVTMRVSGGAPAGPGGSRLQEVEYLMRNGKARVNVAGPGGGMSMLMVPAEKKTYMLVASQNAYMELPASEVAAATSTGEAVPTVTRTGRKETIAGYECETYTITPPGRNAAGQQTDVCVAAALGAYANPSMMMPGAQQPAWQRSLSSAGFPLRVTMPGGAIALEVTKIEKKRLANDLFTVPPTYTKMPAPQFPKR